MLPILNRFCLLTLVTLLLGGCATTDSGTSQAPPARTGDGKDARGGATPGTAADASTPQLAKVVWHVDFGDPRRLSAMIQNVNNMVSTYQGSFQEYDVRIVFVAAGIRFVTEDPLKNTPFAEDKEFRKQRKDLIQRLNQLRELHSVKLELCDITRTALNLPKEKIISDVESVPSGVVRIATLQHQGYAYLKVE